MQRQAPEGGHPYPEGHSRLPRCRFPWKLESFRVRRIFSSRSGFPAGVFAYPRQDTLCRMRSGHLPLPLFCSLCSRSCCHRSRNCCHGSRSRCHYGNGRPPPKPFSPAPYAQGSVFRRKRRYLPQDSISHSCLTSRRFLLLLSFHKENVH